MTKESKKLDQQVNVKLSLVDEEMIEEIRRSLNWKKSQIMRMALRSFYSQLQAEDVDIVDLVRKANREFQEREITR